MQNGKYEIKLMNKIASVGTDRLDPAQFVCSDNTEHPEGILVRSADLLNMAFNDELLCIGRAGIGVNNIPIDRCSEAGIAVFNTPGANANAVKELAVCALLLASRKISDGIAWTKTLAGTEGVAKAVEKGKSQFVGPELKGKTLGVIGLGAIGANIANIAYRLGMDVYGCDPYLTVESAWTINRLIHRVNSRKEIYENCDYITLHVPANKETKGSINASSIAMMKPGVRIINFARGELVETADVLAALDEKQVKVYITDFPADEMLDHPGVVAFPHLGASTPESEDNCARMAAQELIDFLESGNSNNSVNLPNASMAKTPLPRICVIHKNVKTIISQISAALADMNIENMLNKSKGDYAYTMLDVDHAVPAAALDAVNAVDGVIRAFVIE